MNKLGSAIWEQGRPAEAEPLFTRAVELEPRRLGLRNNLGLALWDQGRPAEAAECYRRALELNPAANDVRMNLGVVLSDLGRFDEALEHLREAVRSDPALARHPPEPRDDAGPIGPLARGARILRAGVAGGRPDYAEVHRNRAYGWLYMGDFERGWPEHEWRLRCRTARGRPIDSPLWSGRAARTAGSILLHAEQGLRRHAACSSAMPRWSRTWAGWSSSLADRGCSGSSPDAPASTWRSTARRSCRGATSMSRSMSLPAIFGTTQARSRVASLTCRPSRSSSSDGGRRCGAAIGVDPIGTRWALGLPAAERIGRPLLIGVAWQGSPENPMDRFRSFPLAELAPDRRHPGRAVRLRPGDRRPRADPRARGPVPRDPARRQAAPRVHRHRRADQHARPGHHPGYIRRPSRRRARGARSGWRSRPSANGDGCSSARTAPWYPSMRLFRQQRLANGTCVFRTHGRGAAKSLGMRSASAA